LHLLLLAVGREGLRRGPPRFPSCGARQRNIAALQRLSQRRRRTCKSSQDHLLHLGCNSSNFEVIVTKVTKVRQKCNL
jgi:hypothetical protein